MANFIEGSYFPLKSRRIRLDACKLYGFRCAKLQDEPVHAAEYRCGGQVVAQHIRYVKDRYFTWAGQSNECQLFGQHLWKAGGKRLVISKGEIDALTIAQTFNLKWPVVGVPGVVQAERWIKRNLEWVDSFKDIVLDFGNPAEDSEDIVGKTVDRVGSLFSVGKVRVMTYAGFTDSNEMLMENAGDQIANQVFNAKAYQPDGIVSGADLWGELEKDPEPGLELPYPILQNKLLGMRPGELFLLTAGSGIGKSTFAHELGYHLYKNHGQPLGVMALEEKLKRTGERYIGMHLNKQIHIRKPIGDGLWQLPGGKELTRSELREGFDATINSNRFWLYDHWGSTAVDNLLAKLRYMAVGLDVRWIILDHISIVVSGLEGDEIGEGERRTIDKLMTKLRTLINETGVGVVAIVHLKRSSGNGKSFNQGKEVSLTDLRGSAALEQLSDVIISLERNQQDEENKNYAQMRLLKDRDLGDTGLADVLQYHPDTGRLLLADHNPFEKDDKPFKKKAKGDAFDEY